MIKGKESKAYETMHLVKDGNIGDERCHFGVVNEAHSNWNYGSPGRFGLWGWSLRKGQVVFPGRENQAGRDCQQNSDFSF